MVNLGSPIIATKIALTADAHDLFRPWAYSYIQINEGLMPWSPAESIKVLPKY